MSSVNAKNLSIKVAPVTVDLGDGPYYSPNSNSPSPSEPGSAASFYSQKSSREENIGESKLNLDVTNIQPLRSDESDHSDSASELYISALSSPTGNTEERDPTPHLDMSGCAQSNSVHSFLDMDDKEENALPEDRDLGEALTRKNRSSFSSVESECPPERDLKGIELDRSIYLGDDWASLLSAIEAGVPLRALDKSQGHDADEEFGVELALSEGMASYPTPATGVFPSF
ncbi:hypothetical protein Moror_13745 [Moniliophthora roreri MCA 2997]|uniref:Uncharacterized protein n=2 Tax=Moniliophthora roreri TaxID=221103 RepID=V2XBX4_MONRO|nr:hypothetical protein Moror_13745 [Moniliophthora roreri MCA 2997]KAI3608790.1 hypothetical protein WG66_003746 [Moniliophthora roreri]